MERVTLNVGGQPFTTTLATLRNFGDETLLGTLSRKPGIENQEDPVFLDRDPKLFRHILNCMRHRRVFEAKKLDLSPSLWELELAFYGLPTTEEKKKSKKRPIDVVNKREEDRRRLADGQREKIEAVLMWMLSFYSGKEISFWFAGFDRSSVKKPDDMPQEVFEMDATYVETFEKQWKEICNDNKVHVNFFYGEKEVRFLGSPIADVSKALNTHDILFYAVIRIKCFGD